jgi:hypothetical protein
MWHLLGNKVMVSSIRIPFFILSNISANTSLLCKTSSSTYSLNTTLQKYPSFSLDLCKDMVVELVSTSKVVQLSFVKYDQNPHAMSQWTCTYQTCPQPHETKFPKLTSQLTTRKQHLINLLNSHWSLDIFNSTWSTKTIPKQNT